MGKTEHTDEKASNFDTKQKHKAHKTIREKLRKKRQQQKEHLKEKRQHKKQYNTEQKKHQFFQRNFSDLTKKEKGEFKYKKMKKYIEKFINIYEDDLQDFFELFKQFDEGGYIDIADLQNKNLKKLFKKMFKYLPLKKNSQELSMEYQKRKQTNLRLETLMRNLVSEAIERYLEHGTDQEDDKKGKDEESSNDDEKLQKPEKKSKKHVTVNVKKQDQGVFTLPVPKAQITQQQSFLPSGPSIPEEERQKIAQLFEKQIEQMHEEKQRLIKQENEQFDSIFSSGTTANKLSGDRIKKPKRPNIEDVPDELLAEGSAKIGQKVQLPDEKQYDSIHRPKKLIEEHQEMLAMNRSQQEMISGATGRSRRPFDRERDVVNSQSRFKFDKSGMKNGVFFDFKDKMSAPKKTNNFL